MTTAETIALAVLETFASAYHVAGTDTQRGRVLSEAAKHIAPMLAQLDAEVRKDVIRRQWAGLNPS